MLRRKILDRLDAWRANKHNTALLIRGARQVGKTYIVREFGRRRYQNVVELNFEQNPDLRAIFNGSLDTDHLIQQMSLFIPGSRFIPGATLIFLDEIQSCPNARTAVKFLADDGRFDVIESGSLLGINYKEVPSFPVGYETPLTMFPLDFEEFLWALGIDPNAIQSLRSYADAPRRIPDELNNRMLAYLRQYMAVGGMPQAVNVFVESNNYNDVFAVQQGILTSYTDDIAKYAPPADKPKARACFASIPRQLAKENTKFQYSVVEKRGNARKFGSAIEWLIDAGIVHPCHNVSLPAFPLAAYVKDEQFRIYMTDIGLLTAMYGYEMKGAIVNDTLKSTAKGGIYENLVADMLAAKGDGLYYYRTDNGSVEVEFLLTRGMDVVPVEVKANRGGTASLNRLLADGSMERGYKLTSGNAGVDGRKITLPLYLALFL